MKKVRPFYFLMALVAVVFTALFISACSGDDDDDTSSGDDDTSAGDDDASTGNDASGGEGESSLPSGGFKGVDNGDETVTDSTTGLMWQKGLKGDYLDTPFADAAKYCEDLDLAGHTDWYLPSVDEFRSLIVGCDATMIGGACKASSGCSTDQSTCMSGCDGCELMKGSAEDGYYLDSMFGGQRMYSTSWSSTIAGYNQGVVLTVDYRNGSVGESAKDQGKFNVRCVRKP